MSTGRNDLHNFALLKKDNTGFHLFRQYARHKLQRPNVAVASLFLLGNADN